MKRNLQLNDTTTIAYPDTEMWGDFHVRFRQRLVDGLYFKYSQADREDAVSSAFAKLLARRGPEDFKGKVPKTEADWFWALHWQAKAYLSHMVEKDSRLNDYRETERVAHAGDVQNPEQGRDLDRERLRVDLRETFTNMCKAYGISDKHARIYWDWCVVAEPSDTVADRYLVTKNNLYQIKNRILRVLRDQGRLYFADYRDAC